MGKEPEQPAPKDRTSNRGEGLTPELTGRVCLERAALALPATRRWLTPRGERELGRGPQERTRCPRPTGAQQSHQEDPEAGVTSRGSPHPERAGQSLDPGDRASQRARNRYSRVRAETQWATERTVVTPAGGRPGPRAVQALEVRDLSSPRPGELVTTEAETWAETPSSGAGVFTPGELTPPPPPDPFPKE